MVDSNNVHGDNKEGTSKQIVLSLRSTLLILQPLYVVFFLFQIIMLYLSAYCMFYKGSRIGASIQNTFD